MFSDPLANQNRRSDRPATLMARAAAANLRTMTRRKGELTAAQIDRDYPHQVIVPADWRLTIPPRGLFIGGRKLSLAPRHHSVFMSDRWHIVHCFAEEADAEAFRAQTGGERFDPKRRGRGRNWARVKADGAGGRSPGAGPDGT